MSTPNGLLELLARRWITAPTGSVLVPAEGEGVDAEGLQRLSDRVRDALLEAGLPGRPRLGLSLGEPFAMATALLATMPHATAVPLSASAPVAERLRALAETGAHAVMVDDADAPALAEAARLAGMGLLALRAEPASAARFSLRMLVTAGTGSDAAGLPPIAARAADDADPVVLVLRTSGTTARPKRVPLTSRQLGLSALTVARRLGLGASDRSLNVMPLHHSHGLVGVLLSSMVSGASVAYLPRFEPVRFFDALHRLRPTWFSATPTLHGALLDWLQAHPETPRPPALRLVRSTSAALPGVLAERLERTYGAPLVESFGMTEWSQIASNGVDAAERRRGTVGRATGVSIALREGTDRILEAAEAAGTGITGELLIRGEAVSGVYEGDAHATSEAWCDGWFRTGDLARVDPEGFITVVGRQKEVINRGGEKIAPREIEEALLAHPDVQDAAAFGVPHPTLGEDLLAAVVMRAGAGASAAQLRAHLFERIAEERVPTEILPVALLPRSETGKLARDRLSAEHAAPVAGPRPTMDAGAEASTPQAVAASTPMAAPLPGPQSQLCDLFAEILGRPTVAPGENFFRLGGDSITGMRTVLRINQHFGIRLKPASLFRFPTPEQLAVEVVRLLPPPPDLDDLERQIAGLSDEEVARMLEAEERAAHRPLS